VFTLEHNIEDTLIIDKENSIFEILEYTNLLLIDFSATWCMPCRDQYEVLKYGYHKIMEAYPNLKIMKFDVDKDKINFSRGRPFNVRGIPQLGIVYNKHIHFMKAGTRSVSQIIDTIGNHIEYMDNLPKGIKKIFSLFKKPKKVEKPKDFSEHCEEETEENISLLGDTSTST
jgi:thiol-disulfide isomerase/thioredoxin